MVVTAPQYEPVRRWFLARPGRLAALNAANRWLPRLVYCAYPLGLLALAWRRDARFWKVLWVPAAGFLLVSVFRRLHNAPRPYEALPIAPLIGREKAGRSFPSRHVASAFLIGCAFWYLSPWLGLPVFLAGVGMAVVRPLAGVHFPRDTAAGAAFGLLFGFACLYGLPL